MSAVRILLEEWLHQAAGSVTSLIVEDAKTLWHHTSPQTQAADSFLQEALGVLLCVGYLTSIHSVHFPLSSKKYFPVIYTPGIALEMC